MTKVINPKLEINKKYKIYYGSNNPKNSTFHVLAIVDEDMYVFKWYLKKAQTWMYAVRNEHYFESLIDCGILFKS